MSGRRAALGGPSYAWSRRSTPDRSFDRSGAEQYPFAGAAELGPSTLLAERTNLRLPIPSPVASPVAAPGGAPWAEVKPSAAPHPGTRRAARERERGRAATGLRRREPVDRQREPADRGARPGVVVTTGRAVVLLGLVAGGYTQVVGMGAPASADEGSADPTPTALGELVIDPKFTDFDREPVVNEVDLLRRTERINVARVKAAAIAARARAEAKARAKAEAAAEARARADALDRATRQANRDPRAVARLMVADRGWSTSQFTCLDKLWQKESGWNYRAVNRSSGATGIPQSLPGSKMASAGSDWRTNAVTQIKWGLGYIADRYGTPCNAWAHSVAVNWY